MKPPIKLKLYQKAWFRMWLEVAYWYETIGLGITRIGMHIRADVYNYRHEIEYPRSNYPTEVDQFEQEYESDFTENVQKHDNKGVK